MTYQLPEPRFIWQNPDKGYYTADQMQAAYAAGRDSNDALLRQALDALGTCRIMGADADGNYTKEITPKVIQTAIAALRERLGEKA